MITSHDAFLICAPLLTVLALAIIVCVAATVRRELRMSPKGFKAPRR